MTTLAGTALERTKQTAQSEPQSEATWTPAREQCPHPEHWSAWDADATECEVIEGIAGLVRLLQPEYVLETGTHRGLMAEAIGRSLQANGHGELHTVEIEKAFFAEATERVCDLPVRLHLGDSLDFEPEKPIDFAWLDSGVNDHRVKEFIKFYPQMHDRTIVAFHDSGDHHRVVMVNVIELEKRGLLKPIFLPTPRGVALCQVVK